MPNTVAQHALVAFSSPTNGSTPIDANTVRGNDNTIRTSYNNHDADPGIHVQSSTLAARPAAGTSGRKWMTVDAGSYKLWYDDGSSWNEIANAGLNVFVVAGEILAKGDIIKVTGYNTGIGAPTVAKVASASDVAFGLVTGAIANGSTGYVTNMGLVTDVATNAFSIGNTLYPNTSGGLTSTKPTSGTYQPVAYVLRSDLTNGVLYVEFSSPRITERSDNTVSTLVLRDASGNFAAGTITAALTGNASTATALATARNINGVSFNGTADITVTAAAGTLTGSTLASGVTASSLTSVGTLSSLTVSGNTNIGTTGGVARLTVAAPAASTANGIDILRNGYTARFRLGSQGATDADFWITNNYNPSTGAAESMEPATIKLAAANSFHVLTGATERLSVATSGNLAVDTNTLFVDAVNNRVGVGTAAPAYTVDVSATGSQTLAIRTSTSGDPKLYLEASGVNSGYVQYSRSLQALQFSGQTAVHATLDSVGNLGLGVTPSAWATANGQRALQITSLTALWTGANGGASLGFNVYESGANAYTYTTTNPAMLYQQASAGHAWFTAPSGTAGNAISFTQAMTLDAGGNLLVGDPSATGAVISAYSAANGIIRIRGGSGTNQGGAFFVANSAGSQTLAAFGDSARMLGGSVDASVTVFAGNVPLTFYVNSVERGRYKTTGQLRFVPLSADPGGAETGDVYYNSSTNKLRVYNGAWVDLH